MRTKRALFGPAGNADSYNRETGGASVGAPEWLRRMGLDVLEYQCGNGVRVGEKTAGEIGGRAREHGIGLSVHGPYYISLTNPENLEKNIEYALKTARAARAMGAVRIVVHTGSARGRDRQEALETAKMTLAAMLGAMEEEKLGDIVLCPETMGKINQLGDFGEVTELCASDERLVPCIDFGHLYARSRGALTGYEATAALFDHMEQRLGLARTSNFHAHFSRIEYSEGGEKRHLTFEDRDYGPEFPPVARLVAERGYTPVFICESRGTQAEDALAMKRIYERELDRR